MSSPIISLSHVDAGYPDAVILRDVTFDVAEGEIFALLGGSGCGKSTIMKHLVALNPPLSGEIKVAGLRMAPANYEAIWRRIGVMYQSGALFGSMTCGENVRLPLEEFTRLNEKERAERSRELLGAVGLADADGKLPSEISGGMRKRVAIARAMALDPEIIFLDEPSAGLDPVTSNSLDDLILRLRSEKGVTFVIVTHELPSIYKIVDRCAMFDSARKAMVALGRPSDLRDSSKDPFVREFFNRGGR